MKSLPFKSVEEILLGNGFELKRQNGSHKIFKNPENSTTVILAFHGKSKDIPIGTLLAIIKQSKIQKDKFE